jgi:hypothetical protein
MERTINFGVIKCVVTYFPSILVFGKLLKMECISIALTILYLSMSKYIKNAQATTVLLASLCRNEYNKVSGLDNGRRDGEVRHDKGRGANSNLQQAQDPCQQDSKLWEYKVDGS